MLRTEVLLESIGVVQRSPLSILHEPIEVGMRGIGFAVAISKMVVRKMDLSFSCIPNTSFLMFPQIIKGNSLTKCLYAHLSYKF